VQDGKFQRPCRFIAKHPGPCRPTVKRKQKVEDELWWDIQP
jgi:hypothetical protein